MVALYGSKHYSVGREAARVVNVLRFGGLSAFADRVCGDTVRHIWAATRQGGWIESEPITDDIVRFYVSHEKSEWLI